nr:hypothetical protein [Tanacetum cinerariifolium]
MCYPDPKSCSLRTRQSCSSIRDNQAQAEGQEVKKKRRAKNSGLKRLRKVDADEDVTLVDVDTAVEMDADIQGRMEEDVTTVKENNAAESEPIVFNDEEVTMTMAQTLIKMKAKKARILDEQLAKRLQDEEIEPIFEREYNKVQTFLKLDRDEEPTKKRGAEETLLQESFKKLRVEVEDSVPEFKVEALQVKYPLIDWEIYSEGLRTYWKIIRVGGITQAYQSFEDMLKDFDREDMDALWRIVKERFSITVLTFDKEKALWAELTTLELMLFKTSRKCTNGLLLLVEELVLLVQEFSVHMSEIFESSLSAITPNSPITDSLIIENEHLNIILEMESDEENESSVKDLNLTPSESKDLSEDLFDIEKSDLIESLLNRDTLIISSPKFDYLLKEFSGELAHIDLIFPEIDKTDFDPEEEIRLVEKIFDSLMEEIDIFLAPDDSMPPGIENDDYDSKGNILFLKELLRNDSPSLPKNESFYFYVPSSPRPPAKPSVNDGITLMMSPLREF